MKLKYSYPSLLLVLVLTLLIMSKAANADDCLGNNYEQQMPLPNTKLPLVNITNAPTTIAANQTVILTAEAKVDIGQGGKSSFYWCSNGGFLEKYPSSPNYNSVKLTAPAAVGEIIEIGVQVGDGLGYIDTQVLSIEVTAQNTTSCTPTLLYDNWAITSPSDMVVSGEFITQQWRLKNDSSCEVKGYRLAIDPNQVTRDGKAYTYQENTVTQTAFSIPAQARDEATAEFYAPQAPGNYRLYFDIVDTKGVPLAALPAGRLYSELTVIADESAPSSSTLGSVRGYIWPKEARADGAQWRIAGFGIWHDNAEIETEYPINDYTFECKQISGWMTTQPQIISMMPGKETVAACDYWLVNPSGGTGPAGELTVTYEEERFVLNYQVNAQTNLMIIEYSFNGTNWAEGFNKSIHTIRKGNQPIAINGAQEVNSLSFRLKAIETATNDTFISDVVTVNYETTPTIIAELPATPELFSLGLETHLKQVELTWLKVVDSYYRDNVDYYDLQYATHASFSNPIQLNIGNPATGSNIYESLNYTVTGLEDNKTYYFQIRAINDVGTSDWSNVESIRIQAQDLPAFDLAAFQPQDGATGVSKTPTLCFPAQDADGDPLDFRVFIGQTAEQLHSIRGFNSDYKGQSCLDLATESPVPLSPNTTYYWQVALREQGKDNNYYGGEYIKSPIMQLTTVASGPDLAITKIEPVTEIQVDAKVLFQVTVTNQGNEAADYTECLESIYIKKGAESPFRVGRKCMDEHLAPGAEEVVEVDVYFLESPVEEKGIIYDNVLITGESQIRFQFSTFHEQEMSQTNNQLAYTIHYQGRGPKITYFQLSEYGNTPGPFWVRMGHPLYIIVEAEDDLQVQEVIVQYRLQQTAAWILAFQDTHDTDFFGKKYELPIPTTLEPTDDAQVQVIVRDDQNQTAQITSEVFSIYSNSMAVAITPVSSTYQMGHDLTYQITGEVPNGIARFEVVLRCGSRREYIQETVSPEKNQGLTLANPYQWSIPNSSFYAAPNCDLYLQLYDLIGNYREVNSAPFAIQIIDSDGDGLADDIDPDDDNDQLPDSYEAQYAFLDPYNPSDAAADEDNDGRTNLAEFLQGTDPEVSDFSPTAPPFKIVDVQACPERHSMALDEQGRVWTWGYNLYGQLGDGSRASQNKPILVPNLSSVKAISCGRGYSMALTQDGQVWGWGSNSSGQLGIGSDNPKEILQPVPVNNLTHVKAIVSGSYHNLALKTDGTVWSWGDNKYGQLGMDHTNAQFLPAQIPGLSRVSAIAAQGRFSAAVVNGQVWTWGRNKRGHLGHGLAEDNYEMNPSPTKVLDLTEVIQVASSNSHALALKRDGSVWGWGANGDGSVGDGTVMDKYAPVKTRILNNIIQLACGIGHNMALKQDGTVWMWGRNSGEFGNGTTIDVKTSVRSTAFTDIIDVSGGYEYTLLLRADGTVWTMGINYEGQLGLGNDDIEQFTPVKLTFDDFSNPAPVVAFNISPTSGEVPFTIHLDASNSSDDGQIAHYAWSSSSGQTSTGQQTDITITTAGTHTITLTLTDNFGATASLSKTVNATLSPVAAYCANVTEIPLEECETLVALDKVLDAWDYGGANPCDWKSSNDWERVICRDGHVVAIRAWGDGVYGTTLPDLSTLTHLEEIYFEFIGTSSPIPDLSALTKLKKLYLYRTRLTGPIPSLTGLVNLEEVFIVENQLTGSIPDLIHLPHLKKFEVQRDHVIAHSVPKLTGPVPKLIDLPQLELIDLSGHQLTGSVPDFSQLGDGVPISINLSGNQLTGPVPELHYLNERFGKLDLGNNQLTGTIPNLKGLTQLSSLSLYRNQLTGTIPDLSDLINLRDLGLSVNQLTGTIPDLSGLVNLQSLGLSYNQLIGQIPDLTTLTRLEYLSLSRNQLSGSIPQELSTLTNLKYIYLSDNQFIGTLPDLTPLNYLRGLDVSNNQLTGPFPKLNYSILKTKPWYHHLVIVNLQNNHFCGEIPATMAKIYKQEEISSYFQQIQFDHNHLTTSDPDLIAFLEERNPSWATTQTPMDCSEPLPVNTVSVLSTDGQTYLTLEVTGCDVENVKVKTEMEASQGVPDGAYDFPQGLIEFELPSCEQAEVTVYYHGVTDVSDRVYRKYGPTTPGDDSTIDWYTLPATFATRTIGGQPVATASFTLHDNQLGDDTGPDNLIVDIGGAAKTTCLIYGLHDDGLNNTYFFTVNPTQYFEISPLGEPYAAYDIEALDMNSKGEIYASSGDDAKQENPNGHLYRVERSQGQITSVGDICFSWDEEIICGAEVSALTFHPDDSLWAWAEDYGLIIVNLTDPTESALTVASELPIEDLTWNDSGEVLYGIANRDIWRYDTSGLQKACTLAGEVEVLESLPDHLRMTFGRPEGHDLLMYSYGRSEDVTIRALDVNTCEEVREINIYAPDYYDVEGIVWACDL